MDKATAGNAFSTSGTASAVVDSGKAKVGTSKNEIEDTNGWKRTRLQLAMPFLLAEPLPPLSTQEKRKSAPARMK
jgi:hypothetical protein